MNPFFKVKKNFKKKTESLHKSSVKDLAVDFNFFVDFLRIFQEMNPFFWVKKKFQKKTESLHKLSVKDLARILIFLLIFLEFS